MIKTKQPKGLAPGLYLNLPDDQYHADPALGHSGIRNIRRSPMEFWINSNLNRDRIERTTNEQEFGKKMHLALLQPGLIREKYNIMPFDDFHPAKIQMPIYELKELEKAVSIVRSRPKTDQMTKNGYPEVSIFWRDSETGVMLKTRHDYFKPLYTIDYKTTYDIAQSNITWQISDYAYDIQNAMYVLARIEIRELIKQGKAKIHGHMKPIFKKDFLESEEDGFMFIFQLSSPPYPVRPFHLEPEIVLNATSKMREGITLYAENMEKYGPEQCWPAGDDDITLLEMRHMPRRIYD